MKTSFKKILVMLVAGLATSCDPSQAIASGGLRTVALSNTEAPGAEANFRSTSRTGAISYPVINDQGQVAFWAFLEGEDVNGLNDRGIFSEGGGNGLALVAREGDAVPEVGANLSLISNPLLNNNGQVVFTSFVRGPEITSSNNHGLFRVGGGSGLTVVARKGIAAPDTGEGTFDFIGAPTFNNSGQTTFLASVSGPGIDSANNGGILSDGGGNGLTLVAREGSAAPGTGIGGNFSRFSITYRLNEHGQTAFLGLLTGQGVDNSNDLGIFSEGGGNGLELVARKGSAVPGMGPNVNFTNLLGAPAFNNNGQTVFLGTFNGPGIDSSNGNGIFSKASGSELNLVARAGDAVPDAGMGVNISRFADVSVIDGNGEASLIVYLTGQGVDASNDSGIFVGRAGGNFELVAREGDTTPGTGPGVNFNRFFAPTKNARGQTAFTADLTGPGVVDFVDDRAIFAEDFAGELHLIARTGDLLDVSDDPLVSDLRVISTLGFSLRSGNEDGRPSGFNNSGELVFDAIFTDGTSGVFVSSLVAVPEPGVWALLVIAGLATVGLQHR